MQPECGVNLFPVRESAGQLVWLRRGRYSPIMQLVKSLAIVVAFGGSSATLVGCSGEDVTVTPEKARAQKTNETAQLKNAGSGDVSGERLLLPPSTQPADIPNRSELRVLSEEAKAIENSAQRDIERFNTSLSNQQERNAVQNEFKAMLPEYKDKMLQIGKAKLAEQAKTR